MIVAEPNLKLKPVSINLHRLICFDTDSLCDYLNLYFGFSEYNTVASEAHSKI